LKKVDFYARPGLNVESYDARQAADAVLFVDDMPLWHALADACGGPVLDLATGTGRVAIELARRGLTAVGIDNSSAMLAVARRKADNLRRALRERLHFHEMDMTYFDLAAWRKAGGFALALAPHRAFQLLPDDEMCGRMLGAVFRHLRPGGRFAFDLSDARPVGDGPEREVELPGVRNPETGRFVRVYAGPRVVQPDRRTHVETWRFVEVGPNDKPLREECERLRLRWTPPDQVAEMLDEAGFRNLVYRPGLDAEQRTPRATDRIQVWECVRP
jgi:SAM-dependent methyltransferase